MSALVPGGRGCEQCRRMPGTLHVREATVDVLQYEPHVRELGLTEKDQRIAEYDATQKRVMDY
jgi:hypothetical protein